MSTPGEASCGQTMRGVVEKPETQTEVFIFFIKNAIDATFAIFDTKSMWNCGSISIGLVIIRELPYLQKV